MNQQTKQLQLEIGERNTTISNLNLTTKTHLSQRSTTEKALAAQIGNLTKQRSDLHEGIHRLRNEIFYGAMEIDLFSALDELNWMVIERRIKFKNEGGGLWDRVQKSHGAMRDTLTNRTAAWRILTSEMNIPVFFEKLTSTNFLQHSIGTNLPSVASPK